MNLKAITVCTLFQSVFWSYHENLNKDTPMLSATKM